MKSAIIRQAEYVDVYTFVKKRIIKVKVMEFDK